MSILLSYICYEKILTRLKKLYFYKSACVTSRVAMGTLKKFPSIWSSAVWPVIANIYIYTYYTRLLGRFEPIFHFHCEHVLFVYIVKKNFVDFKNIFFLMGQILKILSSINLPWGQERSYNKLGPDRFNSFDVYGAQTDKQTYKHPDKLSIYKYTTIYK